MMDPVKHCDLYKDEGCAHVDGFLCYFETCSMRLEYIGAPEKISNPLRRPQKIKNWKKEFDLVELF